MFNNINKINTLPIMFKLLLFFRYRKIKNIVIDNKPKIPTNTNKERIDECGNNKDLVSLI